MNILFTCAGRRNYLIQYFKELARLDEMIYAVDSNPFAPALHEADRAFLVPPINDPEYIDILIEICVNNKIGLLVPLNDLELPLLARHRNDFISINTIPLVSSEKVIDICFDKWLTVLFCRENKLQTPCTYLTLADANNALRSDEIAYPLVLKPRWGSASTFVEYVYDDDELKTAYKLEKKRVFRSILSNTHKANVEHSILIQEKLKGQEYGVDVINDLSGRHRVVFVKRKIAMRAGETDIAETVNDPILANIGRNIGESLKHIGNLDCDMFVSESGIYILEMNPRFGGGYPFSHYAGANLPAALMAWIRNEEPQMSSLSIRPGVFSAKCDRLVGGESLKRIERPEK